MNELQQLPDMTPEEAQTKHAELKAIHSVARSMLLEMRDRKGWKALGYSSFAEYGEKEWGYGGQYLNRLATAARIQNIVTPIGVEEIPESHLRPLSKVPDADKSAVYEEAVERALAEGKNLGAKMKEETDAEYIEKNKSLQIKLESTEIMYSESSKQRDQLRDNQAKIIDAKVSEERAKLILENKQAIAQAKREAENAQDKLDKLKKEQDKAIKDGVFSEIQKRKTEIDQLEYRCESLKKQTSELRQTKSELDEEVGTLAVHKKSIKEIKENLTFISASFSEAFDTATMPPECLNDWKSIHYAVSQIKRQIGDLLERKSNIIDVSSLISNLNDIESTFGVSELVAV